MCAGMLTLGVLLPPSYHMDSWGLVDLGQLGPASRYSLDLQVVYIDLQVVYIDLLPTGASLLVWFRPPSGLKDLGQLGPASRYRLDLQVCFRPPGSVFIWTSFHMNSSGLVDLQSSWGQPPGIF